MRTQRQPRNLEDWSKYKLREGWPYIVDREHQKFLHHRHHRTWPELRSMTRDELRLLSCIKLGLNTSIP